MKCALDCVHSCLSKCGAAGTGSKCYAECTKPCLPKCVTAKNAHTVESLAAAAEAHARQAKSHAPHSAAPVESAELEATGL